MCKHVLYRTELFEKCDSRLFSHSRNSRNIVRRISHQPFQINKLCRCKPVALHHFLVIIKFKVADSFLGYENLRFVSRKLQSIPVACNNQRLQIFFLCDSCNGADDVVGLKALKLKGLYVHCVQNVLQQRHLHDKFRRHGFSPCLVLIVFEMPEGRCFQVKCNGDIFRFIITLYFVEHIYKTVYSLRIDAFLRNHRPLHRIKRTIY